jgi:hypothetical protein
VVSITLTQTGPDGQTHEAGQLAVPASQYGSVVQALQNAGQQLQQQVQDKQKETEDA